jgi:hypothetical protein
MSEKLMYRLYTAGQKRLVKMVSKADQYELIILSRKPGMLPLKNIKLLEVAMTNH